MKFYIAFMLLTTVFISSSPKKIMMEQKIETLREGKVFSQEATIFYAHDAGRMVVKYRSPGNHVIIMNNKGELKIYNPQKNQVFLENSLVYSTDLNMLYFFMAGKIYNMGLREMGFQLNDTWYEDGLMISSFYPVSEGSEFGKIELAHEDEQPVFAGYYNRDMELLRKIYYYDYQRYEDMLLPLKSVEYDYLPDGDSIITRKTNSNVKIGAEANSKYFDFKVPEDAKVITRERLDLK
ncbi:MAG: hypothetical protein R6U19_00265 [Bacteroidales bacterium]